MIQRSSWRTRTLIGGLAASVMLGVVSLTAQSADAASSVKLGDRVWVDMNGNGRQDSGEPGIDGVTVRIYAVTSTGDRYLGRRTTVRGWWAAYVPAGGCYRIRVEAPDGYTPTSRDVGSDRYDSDISEWGHTHRRCITGNTYTLDAGYLPPDVPEPTGQTITFYQDHNRNGVRDTGEPNAPDGAVTVTLGYIASFIETPGEQTVDTVDGVATLPATWAPFEGGAEVAPEAVIVERLTPGRISAPPPPGSDNRSLAFWGTSAEVTLDPAVNIEIGLAEPSEPTELGQTYLDLNGNGLAEADEGLADVTGTMDIVGYPNTPQFGKYPAISALGLGTVAGGTLSVPSFLYPGECVTALIAGGQHGTGLDFDGRHLQGWLPNVDFTWGAFDAAEPKSDLSSGLDADLTWRLCDDDPARLLGVVPPEPAA